MEARVKQGSRFGQITAFSGHEYVRDEWRAVPEGCEAEAQKNPYLEVRQEAEQEPRKPTKSGKG